MSRQADRPGELTLPDISVILCTYNRALKLRAVLRSLQRVHLPPAVAWELLVVDNNSTDDTRDVVREYQDSVSLPVRYVFEGRQGHSHARNRGILESRGDILAFTDDDVIVGSRWLAALHATYARAECLGVGGRIVPLWSRPKPAWLVDAGPYQLMKAIVAFDYGDETSVLTTPPFGANMSFRRAAFEKYGLFRTDLGRTAGNLVGSEDTEFGRRLLREGETLIYNPAAVVFHSVEAERLTKRYFERWYFDYGRAEMRVLASSTGRAHRLPVLAVASLHSVGASVVRWAGTFDAQRRFYYRLATCQALGRMLEVCRQAGNGRGTAAVPRMLTGG